MKLAPVPLEGRYVRLEPYSKTLRDEVKAGLDVDPDAWLLLSRSGRGDDFDAWWAQAVLAAAQGSGLSYAVRRTSDDRVVGTTSFLTVRPEHRGLEIGATFLHPDARGGRINPEAKLLMLGHAFGAGALRVEILTDLRNRRSQAAIAGLGAEREGVLRKHKVTWTGHVRDTVIYAITDEDWPGVRARLEARLADSSGEQPGMAPAPRAKR